MGLISRVSSRTYRARLKNRKNKTMNTADYDEFRTYYDYQIENYIRSTQNLNEQKATLAKLVNLQNNDINDVAQSTQNEKNRDLDDDAGDRKLQWMLVNYFDKQNLGNR